MHPGNVGKKMQHPEGSTPPSTTINADWKTFEKTLRNVNDSIKVLRDVHSVQSEPDQLLTEGRNRAKLYR
jgi:hypothetical protein